MTDETRPLVVIVTLNYNNYSDTERCLRSLRTIEYPALEVVVVDNASRDDGPRQIREHFPKVTLLQMEHNLGFSGGNNQGIKHALEQGAEYVMLLNNDTEIREADLVTRMVKVLQANRDIGILAPRIIDGNAGREQKTLLTYSYLSFRDRISGRRNVPCARSADLWSVSGAAAVCWLIPAAAIREVGLMDDAVLIYGEDGDYCLRMRKRGREVVLYDIYPIVHYFKSITNPSMSSLRNQMCYVNKLYFLRKHGGTFTYGMAHLPAFVYRATLHMLSYRPRSELGKELRSCGRIFAAMVKQLMRWGHAVQSSPGST